MDKKLIIANWKSHKTTADVRTFCRDLANSAAGIDLSNKDIIIAPSFQVLGEVRDQVAQHNLPIRIAAQDVSPFPEGAYTGEVNAQQVKEFADFVIVGHSERREHFYEDDEVLKKKVAECLKEKLEVVYCVQNDEQEIPEGVYAVAFEPPSAIGSGEPDNPGHITRVFARIKERFSGPILYGGSVDGENVREFIHIQSCGGLLVGGASLTAQTFTDILSQW